MKRMTRQQSPPGQAHANPEPVQADGLRGILRTRRMKPTHRRQPRGDTALIEANEPDYNPRHLGPAFGAARNRTLRALLSHDVRHSQRLRPPQRSHRGARKRVLVYPGRASLRYTHEIRRGAFSRASGRRRAVASRTYRVSIFRPLARRALMMRRPAGVLIRARKPCRRFRRRRLG